MINVLQGRWEVNLMIDISYHKSMLQKLNSDDSHTMGQEYGRADLRDHLGPHSTNRLTHFPEAPWGAVSAL